MRTICITKTSVESVAEAHATPWLQQWTLRTVEVPEDQIEPLAERVSEALDSQHGASWYADFKSDTKHVIIFRHRIFHVDRGKPEQYEVVKVYGRSLGIPEPQLDFSPDIT